MSIKNQVPPTPEEGLRASFFSRVFLKGKVYMINPDFQWKFMGYVILTVVMSVSIIFLSNYIFFEKFLAKGEALGLPKDHAFFILIKEQRDAMTTIFLSVASVISVIIGFWGLFFSHRIAGPLYRLNLYFRRASADKSEKLPPVFFRENDFFQELPDSINSYLMTTGLLQENHKVSSHVEDSNDDEGLPPPPIDDYMEDEDKEAS